MRSVAYSTTKQLECASQNGEVILCLTDGLTDGGTPFLDARIAITTRLYDENGCTSYVYGLTYDEALLIDTHEQLVEADITGVFCRSCMSDWLESLIPVIPEPEEPPMYETFTSIGVTSAPEEIKAAAGSVRGYYIHNNATSVRYVKLWNSATAPDPSTTLLIPIILAIPKGQAANVALPDGVEFSDGLFISGTKNQAITDVTDPDAGDLTINVFYV